MFKLFNFLLNKTDCIVPDKYTYTNDRSSNLMCIIIKLLIF